MALYEQLVRIGVMPAIAERIVADSKSDKLPTDKEIAEDATVTDEDIELAKAWWLYTPTVPRKFKRLLNAKVSR